MAELQQRQDLAELDIVGMGITFTVYSDGRGIDRAWPFDIVPRVIAADEWRRIERGLMQRLQAINMFIDDLYHDQRVVADGVFPAELLEHSVNFRPQCRGVSPKHGVWAHICGSDLVRDADGTMYVLEDNLRVPSGRELRAREPGHLQAGVRRPVREAEHPAGRRVHRRAEAHAHRPSRPMASTTPRSRCSRPASTTARTSSTRSSPNAWAPRWWRAPTSWWATTTASTCAPSTAASGCTSSTAASTTCSSTPRCSVPDSTLGVPGLMRAWRAGNVAIANAPGAGVADDKVVYAWVPDLIRYYLSEEPLLPNVPTYRCVYDDERQYVIDHIEELVVKPANESGGYGLLDRQPREPHRARRGHRATSRPIRATGWRSPSCRSAPRPRCATASSSRATSTCARSSSAAPRSYVSAGGLTRVALRRGSLIVNSSQGGGSKDTWIVEG